MAVDQVTTALKTGSAEEVLALLAEQVEYVQIVRLYDIDFNDESRRKLFPPIFRLQDFKIEGTGQYSMVVSSFAGSSKRSPQSIELLSKFIRLYKNSYFIAADDGKGISEAPLRGVPLVGWHDREQR